MTIEADHQHRRYIVRYPDGMTAEEGHALLEQARDDLAPNLTLIAADDGATIEGETWHVLSVCLALPLFEVNEIL
ncbi:hypothetical protein IB265_24870 [Ensifer sp. ENS10]|uniref:hypothetical protein n=1 Tax=unclassified Ensifer TaxID=2633371 RepID=UPI00070F93F0|nr:MULTISPECIES: hypothetical protein [unclassified Ensifer]KRD56496.1 hypothetical protein ASE60_08525 [Ensifer sp. Root278]MBD9510012.1 hypothetical protein [Ensifer sp. ENS10]